MLETHLVKRLRALIEQASDARRDVHISLSDMDRIMVRLLHGTGERVDIAPRAVVDKSASDCDT